jgi:hypothetical protein
LVGQLFVSFVSSQVVLQARVSWTSLVRREAASKLALSTARKGRWPRDSHKFTLNSQVVAPNQIDDHFLSKTASHHCNNSRVPPKKADTNNGERIVLIIIIHISVNTKSFLLF